MKELLTRRRVLVVGGASVAALLHEARPTSAQQVEVTPEFGEDLGIKWDELFDLNNQLGQVTGERPREISTTLAPKLEELADYLQPQLRRLKQEIDITEATKYDPKGIYQYYRRMLGGMYPGLLNPEEVIPFYLEKTDIVAWAPEIKNAYARAIRTPALIDRRGRNVYPVYEWVDAALDYARENYAKTPEVCSGDVSIEVDPDITLTSKGKRLSEQHKGTVKKYIQTAPFFSSGMCSEIVLSSAEYGERLVVESPDKAGLFSSHKDPTTQVHVGEIWINMDHGNSEIQPVEQTFGHEAYGHGTDIGLNKGLQRQLAPEKVVERLKFQGEILENPDFGASDNSLQQLLKRRFTYGDVMERVNKGEKITTDEFMVLVTDYPRNAIFYNDFRQDTDSRWMSGIFDTVMGFAQDRDPILGEPRLDGESWYETYDDFLKDYKPILVRDAQRGNLRAKAILWGVDNLSPSLKNYGMIWSHITDPRDYHYIPSDTDKRATTWTNYFTVPALTGIMYHGYVNGIPEIVNLVSDSETQKAFAREVFYVRDQFRRELWADGTGWDHYLGDRLVAPSPYRGGKEHIAFLLSQR